MKIGDLVRYNGGYAIILNKYSIRDRDTRWWVIAMIENLIMIMAPEKHMEKINENRRLSKV